MSPESRDEKITREHLMAEVASVELVERTLSGDSAALMELCRIHGIDKGPHDDEVDVVNRWNDQTLDCVMRGRRSAGSDSWLVESLELVRTVGGPKVDIIARFLDSGAIDIEVHISWWGEHMSAEVDAPKLGEYLLRQAELMTSER